MTSNVDRRTLLKTGAISALAVAAGSAATLTSAAPAQAANWVVLNHEYQAQATGYWCGPAATRIALSARIAPPSQQTLANALGTTVNGTDYIGQVTGVLNNYLGTGWYETRTCPTIHPAKPKRICSGGISCWISTTTIRLLPILWLLLEINLRDTPPTRRSITTSRSSDITPIPGRSILPTPRTLAAIITIG